MTALPVRLAHQLEDRPAEQRWLIEGLWSAQAVGIVGGEPKCCKSFLALDMAVAVAAGVTCLRRFPAVQRGRVLLFAAEDSSSVVRQRLAGIAAAAGVALEALDIHVIVAPVVRLDIELDQKRLEETVARCARCCSCSTPSCACIASTRMYPPRWHHCSTSCAACSDAIRPPSSWCTTRAKAPPTCAPGKRYAAAQSCMPGVTPISTCVAMPKITYRSRSNTALPHPAPGYEYCW